jgi:hypothetical protein
MIIEFLRRRALRKARKGLRNLPPVPLVVEPAEEPRPTWCPGDPEYMYIERPDGEYRAKVVGRHPYYGFLITENQWEKVSS